MLEDLISHEMLGEGSLCIVTSRNKGVLSWDNPSNYMYKVPPLSFKDAEHTFASHVFEADYQVRYGKLEPGFEALKVEIVKACGGIPLVLVVIGRHLKELGEIKLAL